MTGAAPRQVNLPRWGGWLRAGLAVLSAYAASAVLAAMLIFGWSGIAEGIGPWSMFNDAGALANLAQMAAFIGMVTAPGFVVLRGLMLWLYWRHWAVFGLAGAVGSLVAAGLAFRIVPDTLLVVIGALAGIGYWAAERVAMHVIAGEQRVA